MISRLASWSAKILPGSVKSWLYRLGPVSQSIRRLLNANLPQGIQPVEVAAGLLRGATLEIDLHQEKDYWLGTYEVEFLDALKEWIRPGWIAYDVGANIGYLTLSIARLVGRTGQVIAFEAMPEMQERWQSNIQLNPEQDRVRLIRTAVADRSGSLIFLAGPSGGTGKLENAAGRKLDYTRKFEVPAMSVDDAVFVFNNPTPDFIKMDIEGGEVLVFKGMERVMSEIRPLLAVELHGEQAASVVWEMCTKMDYSVHRVSKGYPQVNSLQKMDWKEYILAVPE